MMVEVSPKLLSDRTNKMSFEINVTRAREKDLRVDTGQDFSLSIRLSSLSAPNPITTVKTPQYAR
jgi:hypothetical protein